MTVEQQKIIKSFLSDESGEHGGKELFAVQEEMLITLLITSKTDHKIG